VTPIEFEPNRTSDESLPQASSVTVRGRVDVTRSHLQPLDL